jgi:tellurite methyltransferase
MGDERLDTAYEAWDRSWGDVEERAEWARAEAVVTGFVPELRARGVRRVLDVGGGVGRHALAYAAAGFEVTLTDASANGVAEAARAAAAAAVVVDARIAPFSALPLPDASVDHVLSWNVLYHGDGATVAGALAECRRVLRPGGTLQITLLSKRNGGYGRGEEIRPDTFVDSARGGDKAHPHHYVDAPGACALLHAAGFEVRELVDVLQHPPDGWHWTVLAD